MSFNLHKTIQILNFFAQKENQKFDKIKALKLIWLADKLHLLRYARPITFDDYFAMDNGPVASNVKNILTPDNSFAFKNKYIDEYLQIIDNNTYKSIKEVDFEELSQSEQKVIEEIYSYFGSNDKWDLVDFTHTFPEWKKQTEKLKNNKRVKISYNDFFNANNQKPFNFSNEQIENSKEIFNYYFGG